MGHPAGHRKSHRRALPVPAQICQNQTAFLMNLTLGFSTCPNDTFIFDAMVNGRIDTEGLRFNLHLADVEELNRMAFAAAIEVTKVSYHAFAYLSETYQLLTSGSALGFGNG